MVVGAYAVIFHTEPRYTKDLDIWVEPAKKNAARVWNALAKFGAPLHELTLNDLCNPDMVYQVGIEPNRFDIIMDIAGVTFAEAWEDRVASTYADQPIFIMSREHLLRAKKTANRLQDQLDVIALEQHAKDKS
ncbi:hypothetical protein HUU05_26485 [candidate division KSB1 bacterium]|nr:hypothetical protein [candidate division KSB1 bacterium]